MGATGRGGAGLAGVVLLAVHIAMAMAIAHGWSHAAAIAATARATNAVFGVDWGGGVYANYLFLIVWAAETAWWRASPTSYARRSSAITWSLRIFYFVMIAERRGDLRPRTPAVLGRHHRRGARTGVGGAVQDPADLSLRPSLRRWTRRSGRVAGSASRPGESPATVLYTPPDVCAVRERRERGPARC